MQIYNIYFIYENIFITLFHESLLLLCNYNLGLLYLFDLQPNKINFKHQQYFKINEKSTNKKTKKRNP